MVEKVAAGNFMQLQQPDWSCALQCATGFRWAAILSFPIFLPSNSFFSLSLKWLQISQADVVQQPFQLVVHQSKWTTQAKFDYEDQCVEMVS